jgi:hypothetical protein
MKYMQKKSLITLAALAVALLVLAGVAVKISGGGLLVDSNGQQVATLTLQCNNCSNDGYAAAGKFNFVDHQTGAKLKGDLKGYVHCTADSDPTSRGYATDCILFCDASFLPGAHLVYGKDDSSGKPLAACIQDNGQGNGPPDQAIVVIPPSGASQDFHRVNTIVKGNFKVH